MYTQMKLPKSKYLSHIFTEPVELVSPGSKYRYTLNLRQQI